MIDSGSQHGYNGDGLAAAFVAAGYLTLGLLTTHYLVAYKPRRDAVDSVVLRWPRRCFRKFAASALGSPARKGLTGSKFTSLMGGWLGMCLVNLADVQVLLGFKLLQELYQAVEAEIAAAQWQFVMHLAWFPAVACMCSISVLSPPYSSSGGSSSNAHEWPRLGRAVVLAALLGATLVGNAPTLFFNWEYGRQEASAAAPGTDARRFLGDFSGELRRFGEGREGLSGTHGFQLAVFSVVALMSVAILVLEKVIASPRGEEKMDGPSQEKPSKDTKRCFQGQKVEAHFEDLDDIESSLSPVGARPKPKTFGSIFSDAAAFFVKFNLDLLTSRFAEIFFLFVLQFWGVARLYGSIPKSEGQISNGQALWSFSQELPLALLVVPFIVAINTYLLRDASPSTYKVTILPVSASSPSKASSGKQDNENEPALAVGSNSAPRSYPTPLVAVSLLCASGLVLVVTVAFFAAAFNMMMGFEPQFLVSEALFTQIGVFWVLFPGYPLACFATGLAAYAMERCWIHKRRGSALLDAMATSEQTRGVGFSKWRVGDYLVLFVVGAAAHAFSAVFLLVMCLGTRH
ncbi:hypothetical protein PG985_013771 [Apiospora marii]|uniref:Uncharacterized protein n=1 Tax=Apiospora marii TaxID=335849 RepID=A0ABR1R8V3_9PEZI